MKYCTYSTNIGRSVLNKILLGQRKIQLRLAFKNGSESLILNLLNMFYLPNSLCNLLSLKLLDNSGIYHGNENKSFYKMYIKQILVQA